MSQLSTQSRGDINGDLRVHEEALLLGVLMALITNAIGAFFWSVLILNNQLWLAYEVMLPQALAIAVLVSLVAHGLKLPYLATAFASQVGWFGGILGSGILRGPFDPGFQWQPSEFVGRVAIAGLRGRSWGCVQPGFFG